MLRCKISTWLTAVLGHFRQIDPLPTLSACPLRSDRVRIFAPRPGCCRRSGHIPMRG
jgi:hypothetical protein